MGWIFVAVGGFAIVGAAMNWEWFLNHRKARIFYGLLGAGLATLGVLIALEVIAVNGR